jgi:hypothetical protein
MKRARLGAPAKLFLVRLVIPLLAMCGLALGLTASASATTARPGARAAVSITSVQPVVFNCPGHQGLVKPSTLIITCADGNTYLSHLTWTSWAAGLASAKGVLEENDCTPYCAAGHFHAYPAVVILWGNAAVKNHLGEHAYAHMTLILTGTRPRYYDYPDHKWVTEPQTQTSALLTSPGALSPL